MSPDRSASEAAAPAGAAPAEVVDQVDRTDRAVPADVLTGAADQATTPLPSGAASTGRRPRVIRRLRRRVEPVLRDVAHEASVRWRRSLQLRVATTTVLISGIVVFVVGLLSVGTITAGLLEAKRTAARAETANGVKIAQDEIAADPDEDVLSLGRTLSGVQRAIARRGTAAGLFSIAVVSGNADPYENGQARAAEIPADLRQVVQSGRSADVYAPVRSEDGRVVKGLITGAPVPNRTGSVELYYFFPLSAEQKSISLVRTTVLLTGILLVLLVAAVAALVTRQVVRPVRAAARTAERLAGGRLQERMQVRGEDDLAMLAAAFNDMADSLQRQIGKLEEMGRLQRRFTSDVSHELRTPLTTIRMATDVLHASRDGFEPAVSRSAELLQTELDRFEGLLADLLEISRHDAHVAVLEPDPVDLRGLVRTTVAANAGLAERAGSTVVVDMPDFPVVAEVDGRRVTRILRNLLVNAIEHGEGQPIEVRLRGDDTAVAVTVRDHGVGLRPGEAALVFDRFWRADPSRDRRTGGTGLGLAISLEDARLHGGWLHAWGRPGQGAQFRLTLPVSADAELSTSPLPIEPADALRQSGRLRRPTAPLGIR